MKINTSELSGVALDWAVAMAVGMTPSTFSGGMISYGEVSVRVNHGLDTWSPSTDWSQGGPLIERFRVDIITERAGMVAAYSCGEEYQPLTSDYYGSTALIATCRAIVAAKLGDEVDVPEGLV